MAKFPEDLFSDPLLQSAPSFEGFKVLDPAVLYAKVGQGGMGAVYRGRHFKLDLDVAVKCLKPSLVAEDPDFVRRFEREARLAASIGHQNVVRVLDVQEKNGLHYLVMEFVRGETAAERVRRKGKLAEQEALAILLGACAGLAEAHQRGIVHRDIKPDNVMISLEGRVKLADLGLAKSSGGVDGRSVSMPASRIMGTPQYMPPEQWDTTDVTPAADIWALGASFYFLCTGRAGISGAGTYHAVAKRIQEHDYPTLRASRPDLRPEVHAMFERCVARDPKDRLADARVLLRELRKMANDDEDVLLDPETGTGIARAGTVTPPPRSTLAKIRVQVQDLDRTQGWSGPKPRSEQPTMPAAGDRGQADDAKSGSSKESNADATRDSDGPKLPSEQQIETSVAREMLILGLEALPVVGKLDDAIAAFERVLQLDADSDEARRYLVLALSRKARDLEEKDLEQAYDVIARACTILPDDAVAMEIARRLAHALQLRSGQGLKLVDPANDAVLADRSVRVRGIVIGPKFRTVRVVLDERDDAVSLPFPREQSKGVQVVAGEFETTLSSGRDGHMLVRVEAEDRRGLFAEAPVHAIVVRWKAEGPVAELAWGAPAGDAKWVVIGGMNYPSIVVEKQTGMRMVLIPPGEFTMGSPDSEPEREDYETQHRRVIRKAFYLGETGVTQKQWQGVMGSNPSSLRNDENPVESVSWNDCQQFLQKLNQRGAGFRLPSEAEWEYACRAGTTSPFSFGANITTAQVNYAGNYPYNGARKGEYRQKTVRVRSLPANAFGLFEMHGNVWEWCEDTYAEYPGTGTEEPTRGEGSRVLRGGSWLCNARDCRSADRLGRDPTLVSGFAGFRLSRTLQ